MTTFFSLSLRLSIIPLVLLLGLVAACSDNDDDDGDSLSVVASLPLFADIVENVAGERAEVDSLLPAGADPHTYEPSPGDVRKVVDADIVFANGLDLEPAALQVIEANISSGAIFVELAEASVDEGLATLLEDEHEGEDEHMDDEDEHEGEDDEHQADDGHDHAEGNPHLWMDPAAGRGYAEIILNTLIEADPDGADVYNENYETYVGLLAQTDVYIKETVAVVPEEQRLIVSTHDAFDYLARAIGFEVAGFVVPSPGQEPSPQDVAGLIETIQDFGIPAVFSEPQTDEEGRTLEQIADEADVEVCTLYSDSFGETVTTYVDLLRFDAEELARCLGGGSG